MNADLVVGIDVGTYETKGVVCDAAGTVVAQASHAHTMSTPRPGWAEHDAERDWWGGFVTVVRSLLAADDVDASAIAAVGASGIGPCVLPIDAAGEALRPAILYGVDTRATRQMATIEDRLGREMILQRCGNVLSTQSAGPKIAWIRETEPEVFAAAHRFVSSQSFLVGRLTGRWVMDHGTAAYFHPLYDLAEQDWYGPWCEGIVDVDRLPELGWASEIAGHVTRSASEQTGLPVGTPVIVGTTDAPAEAVSAGVTTPGRVMVMYGSTIFMIAALSEPVSTSVLWSAPYVFPGTYVLAGGTATAGTLTHWFRDLLTLPGGEAPSFGQLADEASDSPAGANGLVLLPYFSGERTPVNDPGARGLLAGLDLTHTRGDVMRAILEGIAQGVRANLQSFVDHGAQIEQLRAVGGGTKNHVWAQAVADATGHDQHIVAGSGASLGDAALAAVAVGLLDGFGSIDSWVRIERTTSADPDLYELYQAQGRRAVELYQQTRSIIAEGMDP